MYDSFPGKSFDPAIWVEARQRLPLPRLMELLGDGHYLTPRAEYRDRSEGRLSQTRQREKGCIDVCYVGFGPIFQAYQADKRSRGEDAPLSLGDLRRELEKDSYWVSFPRYDGERVHRISMGNRRTSCWVTDMEPDNESSPYPLRRRTPRRAHASGRRTER